MYVYVYISGLKNILIFGFKFFILFHTYDVNNVNQWEGKGRTKLKGINSSLLTNNKLVKGCCTPMDGK